jgi:hypothetical protein
VGVEPGTMHLAQMLDRNVRKIERNVRKKKKRRRKIEIEKM